jgi:hypothetical protein
VPLCKAIPHKKENKSSRTGASCISHHVKDRGRLRRGPTRTTSCTDRRTRRKRNKGQKMSSPSYYIESPEILLEESSAKTLNVPPIFVARSSSPLLRKMFYKAYWPSARLILRPYSSKLFIFSLHLQTYKAYSKDTRHSTSDSCLPVTLSHVKSRHLQDDEL